MATERERIEQQVRAVRTAMTPLARDLVGDRGEIVVYVQNGRISGADITRKTKFEAGEAA